IMSRRRVKNIALNDDEDYDVDESFGHSFEDEPAFGVSPATANAYLFVRDKDTGGRITQPPLPDVKEEPPQSAPAPQMARLHVATAGPAHSVKVGFAGAVAVSPSVPSPSPRLLSTKQQQQQQAASSASNSRSASPAPPRKNGADPDSAGGDSTEASAASAAAAAEAYKRYCAGLGDRAMINLVIIGHVDAGKSTLIGHLLYLLGAVSQKVIHRYEQECRKAGKPSFQFAWVLDESEEERQRGVTMDVARSQLSTRHRLVNLLDCPGHKDFIPNMISGAMAADAALLVINATRGEFESGFDQGGQTREHALLARGLGIGQLVVAINKMDTAKWSETRFAEIRDKLGVYLKSVGFKPDCVSYCPVSGLEGANLNKPLSAELCPWYASGPTLVDLIDRLTPPARSVDKPLRFYISEVSTGGRGAGGSGAVACFGNALSGYAAPGHKLLLLPANQRVAVKAVTSSGQDASAASGSAIFAGDSGTISVSGGGVDPAHFGPGSVLSSVTTPCPCTNRLRAKLLLLNVSQPVTKGYQAIFHQQAVSVPVTIIRLLAQINKSTGQLERRHPRYILSNCCAEVELQLDRPLCLDVYTNSRELGKFMLRDRGVTVAAGTVVALRPTDSSQPDL
ncbi:hypothetical protein BOX15_Mlig033509g1, partial [Macrostomum lignano]